MRMVLALAACALWYLGCSGGGFKVLSNPAPDDEGFITKDILQVVSAGYPSRDAGLAQAQRQTQAYSAAEIHARMRVVEFLLEELKNENAEKYQSVVTGIGERLSSERYDLNYSPELVQGGQRVNAYFELFAISGYVHTNTWNEGTGRCSMLYRVAKANFVEYGKSGFGIGD